MPHAKPCPASARALGAAGLLVLLGCGSYANIDRDLEDRPVTNTGVAATILMPGDNGIPMPPTSTYGGLGPPPAPAPGAASGSSSASGAGTPSGGAGTPSGGGGMTMIGGTTQEIERHEKIDNEPAWAKVAKLPFAIAAYPFKKAHQAVTGPPDPTVKVSGPPPEAPPTPAELQAQRESALLEGMERELSGQRPPPPTPAPHGQAPVTGLVPSPRAALAAGSGAPSIAAERSGTPSIAAELAALRRAMAAPAPGPAPKAAEPPPEQLYESVDRDADGRPDRWLYRQGTEVVAEATDDDGDGRPERRVEYRPGTQEPAREEEDTNADGRADTFTEYEGAAVARRRADSDGDGEIDAWSFYQDGQLLRHEHDTNADGFRDRMTFYEAGRLVREEEDSDGNGRPDRITRYDEQERIASQEEDTDADGVMDLRSYYQEGKLRRREMID